MECGGVIVLGKSEEHAMLCAKKVMMFHDQVENEKHLGCRQFISPT